MIAEAGEATDNQIEIYSRTSNTLRRLLQTLGLERRLRPVETLDQYLHRAYPTEEQAQSVESFEESTE